MPELARCENTLVAYIRTKAEEERLFHECHVHGINCERYAEVGSASEATRRNLHNCIRGGE